MALEIATNLINTNQLNKNNNLSENEKRRAANFLPEQMVAADQVELDNSPESITARIKKENQLASRAALNYPRVKMTFGNLKDIITEMQQNKPAAQDPIEYNIYNQKGEKKPLVRSDGYL